jgi:hypothetical protein
MECIQDVVELYPKRYFREASEEAWAGKEGNREEVSC